jgi:hypothetical protein
MNTNIAGFYERDRIHTPPGNVEAWSENLLVWGHDHHNQISLWTHMGRMTYDPTIWEGVAYIYLPNGELLVHRSMGNSIDAAVVNAEYRYTPVIPGQTWLYHFDGLAQRVAPDVLARGMIHNEPYERASFNLVFDGVHPVFDFGGDDMEDQGWATMHLEQGGTLRGEVIFEGKRHYINCTGYRDHSVGPRTNSVLLSETWAHCVFPSGRCYSGLQITEEGHKPLLAGYIYEDSKILPIKPTVVPELRDTMGNPRKFDVEATCGERVIKLSGKMTGPHMTMTLRTPVGIGSGFEPGSPERTVVVEAPAIFEWDGETGYGWIERIRRVSALNKE